MIGVWLWVEETYEWTTESMTTMASMKTTMMLWRHAMQSGSYSHCTSLQRVQRHAKKSLREGGLPTTS
jgi:hypothetical protein